MTETVQLHLFQLFYTFICKRLVLMGKTVLFFFYHLNIYHHVCCLLSNLKSVLWGSKLSRLHVWLWWMPQGWRWGGWLRAHGGTLGTCQGRGFAASRTDGRTCCIHSLCHSECGRGCFFLSFGFFFFLLSFLSTHFVLFFLLLNLTCILSFCGVIYLVVDFLCYLVDLCWTNHV